MRTFLKGLDSITALQDRISPMWLPSYVAIPRFRVWVSEASHKPISPSRVLMGDSSINSKSVAQNEISILLVFYSIL